VVSGQRATYLDRIVEAHKIHASADKRSAELLRVAALSMAEPARGFTAALREPGLSVIAEVKRRSPSKGDLFAGLDPATLAGQYAEGGAACMSVLTDVDHFGGSIADLQNARAAVLLPVIRKDFTVDVRDVYDTRLIGADCVLLIAAALTDDELREFHAAAIEVGLDALVEIHDEAELERALAVGATLIGVNQRDLHTFQVDQERAVRVGQSMPASVVRVAESGVRGPEDAATLFAAGFHAVLVGESLVTSGDPTSATRSLREASLKAAMRADNVRPEGTHYAR
jgi:indole-3-glycerol phosphate synthase